MRSLIFFTFWLVSSANASLIEYKIQGYAWNHSYYGESLGPLIDTNFEISFIFDDEAPPSNINQVHANLTSYYFTPESPIYFESALGSYIITDTVDTIEEAHGHVLSYRISFEIPDWNIVLYRGTCSYCDEVLADYYWPPNNNNPNTFDPTELFGSDDSLGIYSQVGDVQFNYWGANYEVNLSEVPLPAGIYLFLSGLVGLGLMRGRNG